MKHATEVAVTLTPELFNRLSDEARLTGVPLVWLVASLVVDTLEGPAQSLASL